MSFAPHFSRWCLACFILLSLAPPCFALEPTPRKWNHLPTGANFAGVGYAYTEADIFIDPALTLEDVKLEMKTLVGKYIRTFELFDKSARIDLTQGYQDGKWTGLLGGVPASTTRTGWSDSFVRFALNLYGAPPLSGKEFMAYRSKTDTETIVGMGLVIRLPTGEYMQDRLINLGKNRFAFRPQMGILHTRKKWTVEAIGEVAFYTDNDKFFNGNTLEEKPLYIIHAHLVHTFRPGFWASVSIAYDYGGETTINGIDKDDTKQDIGWAFSLAYPITRASGFKVAYIGTRTQESTGFDSNTLAASFSFLW